MYLYAFQVVPRGKLNVTAVMETWVKQKGFPLITVRITSNEIILNQKRFLSSPFTSDMLDINDLSPFGYKWIIPITIITSYNPKQPELWWMSSKNFVIPLKSDIHWYKININHTGFYRVNYDDYNWHNLIRLLERSNPNTHILSPTDRANLIDDAFAFLKMNLLEPSIGLGITSYLEKGKERDHVPWEAVLINLKTLETIMGGHPLLRQFILKLLKPALRMWEEGWKDEGSHIERKLRSSIFFAAAYYGDDTTVKIARQNFGKWLQNGYQPPPNFRLTIYMVGVKHGDIKEWDFCWSKYVKESVPSEKRLLLKAMSHTQNVWLLWRFLNYSLNKDKIKPQDTVHVITDVARNPIGRFIAWRFVKQNWKTLLSLFGQGSFSMDAIISETSWHFSHRYDYQEVAQFYQSVDIGSGMLAVRQTLERIEANIFWKENVEQKVINFLQSIDYSD